VVPAAPDLETVRDRLDRDAHARRSHERSHLLRLPAGARENELAEDLRTYLIGILKDQKVFLGHLANMAIKNSPPIGFFKSFVVEKDGAHKNELNLKVKGVAPLVDIIRLFALERGVRETATLERLDVLRGSHTIVQEYADEFEHALEFIMLLRIHHQFAQMSAGGRRTTSSIRRA